MNPTSVQWSTAFQTMGPVRTAVVLMLAVPLFLATTPSVLAQRATARMQRPPLYVGEPVRIEVEVNGFEEQPDCQPGPIPEGLQVAQRGVPGLSIQQTIIGNVVQTRSTYMYAFDAVADKPGTFQIAPFTVTRGKRTVSSNSLSLQIHQIDLDPSMRVALILPSQAFYPGQRVPVTIEWWYAGDLSELRNLIVRSPLFDQFTFIDEPARRGSGPAGTPTRQNTVLPLSTAKGTIKVEAKVLKRVLDGRQFLVIAAQRLLAVDRPGKHEVGAITANVEKVVRWGRDFWGDRVPIETTQARAMGRVQQLVIKPLPLERAPPSFGGAVGRGFTIGVKADRSVVNVGDPITLSVTLRGEGNLETAALPPLSTVDSGLDAESFRLPTGDVAGALSEDGTAKTFTVTVRVLDESVTEIPPVAYSWFEPETGQFQTVDSDPIALRVLPAQYVGAQDVVNGVNGSSKETINAGDGPAAIPTDLQTEATIRRFTLAGADLAIEPNAAILLIDESQRFGGRMARAVIYGGSVLLVIAGWCRRRLSEVNPQLVQRRKLMRQQVKQVVRAAALPRQQAASQIATALRRIEVHAASERRCQIDQLVAECDVLTYARDDGSVSQTIEGRLCEQAASVARAVADEAV